MQQHMQEPMLYINVATIEAVVYSQVLSEPHVLPLAQSKSSSQL